MDSLSRRLPVGAEPVAGGVHFRVWAPGKRTVEVVLEDRGAARAHALTEEPNGYWSALIRDAAVGARYCYRLDGAELLLPDPASRFQPDGPHGPSVVVDAGQFQWTDDQWTGIPADGRVIYEMHIGTFTPEGTWAAAMRHLRELAAIGVTVLELLPVSEFAGRFGWGYDGVDLYAPTHLYGEPDDFRRFVDAAHASGLGVILDVVYNHLGPDGNYLGHFSQRYFSEKYTTDWGEAINFDGACSAPVREYFGGNAGYWVDEFHLDGLRIDATQNIYDSSEPHILAEIAERVRSAARGRLTYIVAENEPQDTTLLRPPPEGGYGLDGIWNDDWHHTARVALTGRDEAYYTDYRGTPQELISAAKRGFLYQGQWYRWQKKRRGTSTRGIDPARFVIFLQNHDQVANSYDGRRLHSLTSPGRWRALTALLLLGPNTPMLFQGQEFAASSPWLFFADHTPELAMKVREGRRKFLAQFPSIADPAAARELDPPDDPATFERCKLRPQERTAHAWATALHRDLLELRRTDPVLRAIRPGSFDGAVLGPEALVLRFEAEGEEDRLLVVNLGRPLRCDPAPEPLLAPPDGRRWHIAWASESPRYGTASMPPLDADDENWRIPGECAALLIATPMTRTERDDDKHES